MKNGRIVFLAGLGLVFLLALFSIPGLPGIGGGQAFAKENTVTITSEDLTVQVDKDFPRVIQYKWNKNGAILYGQDHKLSTVRINGEEYHPTVTSKTATDAVIYHLSFSKIDVNMTIRLEVAGNVLSFKVTKIEEKGAAKVNTLSFPDQSIIAVHSNQPNAEMASARLPFNGSYGDHDPIDQYRKIADLPTDEDASGATMAILNTDQLAAALATNSLGDQSRLLYKTTDSSSYKATGLWSGVWTYRGGDGKIVALPWEKVVLTDDQNSDDQVDWQDGAIAFRDIMTLPKGSKDIDHDVVNQIAFNIASQPTHPFLRTLDEVKKSYLLTDGLGQSILLKGYQDQGHDSSHPDYGNHYNKAAGGLKDLKYLVNQGKKYNTSFGVHINQQEMYPEAKNFRWDLTNNLKKGWAWMDQSYQINQKKDVAEGSFQKRIKELKKDVPNLSWIYVDVYFDRGWDAHEVADTIHNLGWGVHTEFEDYMWPNALYYHRANQYDGIGVNSKILRFIYNEYKDVWVKKDAMLMGDSNLSFMGWMGQNDINKWSKRVFTNNLPTKYMQNFPIVKWSDHRIDFKDHVHVTKTDGKIQIFKDNKLVMNGSDVFLPWDPKKETKIYHWNMKGGTTTWQLPDSWAKEKKVVLYKLTDTGKKFVKKLSVKDGKVTIKADKDTPYVIYKQPVKGHGHTKDGKSQKMDWGEGGFVKDPHFFSHSFKDWKRSSKSGDVGGISVVTDDRGYQNLQFAGTNEGTVSQRIKGLKPGNTYSASVWVEVKGKRKAVIGVKDYGGKNVSNWTDESPAVQYTASNPRQGSHFQRMKVLFTVPKNNKKGEATLYLKTEAGDSSALVQFADVRVVENNGADQHKDGKTYYEDFEHVDQGWGPFVYGHASGDPTIHLSGLHKGYTRDTISGKRSLKILNPGKGMQYRTLGQTLRLDPNHTYKVTFDYQADASNLFNFVVQSDHNNSQIVSDKLQATTDRPLDSPPSATGEKPAGWTDSLPPQYSAPHRTYTQTVTTGGEECGEYYIGVTSPGGSGALTIDNLSVEDLGTAKESNQCPAAPTGELQLDSGSISADIPAEVTGSFTNHSSKPEKDVTLDLNVPKGWSVKPVSDTSFEQVGPGKTVKATWNVTPDQSTTQGSYDLAGKATFLWNDKRASTSAVKTVQILPPPPTKDSWLSDLAWINASNGWGPVEKDMSNGGNGKNDGQALTLNGATFQKGLGAHAASDIEYFLGGNCSSFAAKVGVDDEMTDNSAASVDFQVWGDGKKLYDSGMMTAVSKTKSVDVDVKGVDKLKLIVTDGGNGNGSDHADWANARIICE
ncbi:endo-alpha-N-acetylgalactosaminidase [Scopulibacillus darangshiensis]|uniref:Endo-alpha-N-acetylgalactosaminidase n=1 Tax=Scopulibacillus darangshiensis TaxID=442528 RepID=A0A4R2NLD8_9BACL|nr:endo-alpha-N-acetylgalactosaminidase family protein [Scopulibacillus darangshiensis]TCP22341.1 endo-alpha-N-acetylgalactosaminidase [Scopulibacillus darangshiensis]